MTEDILFTIWFFLPAALANSTPVVVSKTPVLKEFNYPLDLYKKFEGKRVLGDHKTIRGLIVGVVTATIVVLIQKELYSNNESIKSLVLVNYSNTNIMFLGILMGLGTIVGDAVKSFFKRRRALEPGSPWIPFDQIDFILGSSLLSLLYIKLPLKYYLLFLVLGLFAHFTTNIVAYMTKLKDVPY